jgi:DNA-binding NtrC family response regulator
LLRAAQRGLSEAGFEVLPFASALDAWEALEANDGSVDAVLTDIHLPGRSGLDLLERSRARWRALSVVLMTGQTDIRPAVQALRLGAYDYLLKPFDVGDELVPVVRRAVEHTRLLEQNRVLRRRIARAERPLEMIGESARLRELKALIAAAAPTDSTVLILGESGTGKELVARELHAQSERSERAFVDINCAALSESLLESELFGHARGAFTGAVTARRGLFEEASGGTLFLDEVGELSPGNQARLLRVLQDGTVRPVGSNESRRVDVRVVAATNRDLQGRVRSGDFREDLYYRLCVLAVHLPPLRERQSDIPLLVRHFLAKHGPRMRKVVAAVEPAALERLVEYAWPGNVRELENVIERALILARSEVLTCELLPPALRESAPVGVKSGVAEELPTLARAREQFEREYCARALHVAAGSLSEAARLAEVDRSNFRRMVKRLGLDVVRPG